MCGTHRAGLEKNPIYDLPTSMTNGDVLRRIREDLRKRGGHDGQPRSGGGMDAHRVRDLRDNEDNRLYRRKQEESSDNTVSPIINGTTGTLAVQRGLLAKPERKKKKKRGGQLLLEKTPLKFPFVRASAGAYSSEQCERVLGPPTSVW